MKDRIWYPSSCPICSMYNTHSCQFTHLGKWWEDLSKVKFQCGFCYSIFWWKKETRESCGLESNYPLTRSGWNTMIRHIDPKYEDGDVCPRCNGDLNYKDCFGNGKCVVCGGDGIYTRKKAEAI